MGKRKS